MKFFIALLIVNICFANAVYLKNFRPAQAAPSQDVRPNQDTEQVTQGGQNPIQVTVNTVETSKNQETLTQDRPIQTQTPVVQVQTQTPVVQVQTQTPVVQIQTPTPLVQSQYGQLPIQLNSQVGQYPFLYGQYPYRFVQYPFRLRPLPFRTLLPISYAQMPVQYSQYPFGQFPVQNDQLTSQFRQYTNPFVQVQNPVVQFPNPVDQLPTELNQVPSELFQTQYGPMQMPMTLQAQLPVQGVVSPLTGTSVPAICLSRSYLPICQAYLARSTVIA